MQENAVVPVHINHDIFFIRSNEVLFWYSNNAMNSTKNTVIS